jgi:enamine deaminase RidA (YjgF/YER057c/UK114 family)
MKSVPSEASQHTTAGPYSPVIEVQCGRLIVISGQVAIAPDGAVVGETIEEQTEYTLRNCLNQLSAAGASLAEVFKVNVYLTDLRDWPAFNTVYARWMPKPWPVRTAVQAGLLLTLKVEIEMWAMLP